MMLRHVPGWQSNSLTREWQLNSSWVISHYMDKLAHISRRGVLAGGAAVSAVAATGVSAPALAARERSIFIELFSSQGCSSCPPADAFMGELIQRPDIVGVSMNVDYWDYLGWRDTLASAAFTRRQKEYADRRGDGRVYTPQMVINGRAHAVGSHKQDVLSEVERQIAVPDTYFVSIEVSSRGGELHVDVAGGPTDRIIQSSTVWVMSIEPKVSVEIRRGENTGRTIDYFNVVRQMTPIGMWKGEAASFNLPKAQIVNKQNSMCVVVLQVDGGGPVLGCAEMKASA